jgi:excisionase family DNA binding protein
MERLTLTVEEAAIALGISRSLAYDLARRGDLPVLRLGHRLLVSRAGLMKMLNGQQQPGVSCDEVAKPHER